MAEIVEAADLAGAANIRENISSPIGSIKIS
jgi:hypothetical protein